MSETLVVLPRSRGKPCLDGTDPWSYPSPPLVDRLEVLRPYFEEIILVAGHDGPSTVHRGDDYQYYKVDTGEGRFRSKWRYARRLVEVVGEADSPTVLNFDPNLTGALFGLLGKAAGGRLVTKFIGLPSSDPDRFGKHLVGFWLLLRFSDAAVTISPYCQDILTDIYDRDVSVVPNRIDAELPELESESLDQTILYVGRFDAEKRIPLLLEAFAELCQSCPDARLVMVGGDDSKIRKIRAKAEELGVIEQTQFEGWVPRETVIEWMHRATVFTLPTAEEAFGMVVLEALACGTPVVGHNGGALPWLIGDAGKTVDVTDTEEFANALMTILADEEKREKYRLAAIERAKDFPYDTWGEDLYDAIK